MNDELDTTTLNESVSTDIFKNAIVDIKTTEVSHVNLDVDVVETPVEDIEQDQKIESDLTTESSTIEPVVETPVVTISTEVELESGYNPDPNLPNICPDDQLQNDRLNAALTTLTSKTQLAGSILAEAHRTFYAVLSFYLVRKQYSEFKPFFTNLLNFVNIHIDGRFECKRRFEAHELITGLTKAQMVEFSALVNLLSELAPLASRLKNARSINWNTVQNNFQHIHAELITNKLKQFFNV